MSNPTAFRQRCARCGSAARRAHRDRDTRRAAAASGLRRYRCTAEGCDWQGLLPRLSRAQARSGIGAVQRQWRRWAWPAAAMAALGLAAAAVVRQGVSGPPPLPVVPAGESHYGRPLNDAHPLQVKFDTALAATQPGDPVPGLSLRQHCAWGRPGGNPYRGTVTEALQAAGLPAEVVADIAGQVRKGEVLERLTIAIDGIHAAKSGRVFSPAGMAMTYGRTLCLGTHVNFAPGHTEPASLYEARDSRGRLHSVMVPDVCGNVTMISQGLSRKDKTALTGGGGGSADVAWLVDIPDGGRGLTSSGVNAVPEPGTLWGVGTGLALLAWFGRRRRAAATSGPKKP
jgi:hypothetical protein